MEQRGQEVVQMLTLAIKAAGYSRVGLRMKALTRYRGDAPDPATTMRVTEWLQQRARDPAFNMCLAHIAAAQGAAASAARRVERGSRWQLEDLIRQMAAIRLKNNIVRHFDAAVRPNLGE
eukprot:gene11613-2599_t